MKYLDHVGQNSVEKYGNLLIVAASIILITNFTGWFAATLGFTIGASAVNPSYSDSNLATSLSGGTYEGLKYEYLKLVALAFGALSMSFIRFFMNSESIRRLLGVSNMFLLGFSLWKLRWMLALKDSNLNESLGVPFNKLLLDSIPFDIASVAIVIIALCVEILLLLWITGFIDRNGVSK